MTRLNPGKVTGRKCYDHLGGRLGAELLNFLLAYEWIKLVEGRSTVYEVTPEGYQGFERMGLSIEDKTHH